MSPQNPFQKDPKEFKRNLDDFNRSLQENETKAKAGSLHLPYIDLKGFPVDLAVLGMLTKEEVEEIGAVPFYKEKRDLRVGVIDPDRPSFKAKLAELSLKDKPSLYLISQRSLNETLRFYSKILRPKSRTDETIRIEQKKDFLADLKNLQNEQEQKKENMSEIFATIFASAMQTRVSDIHLEPEDHFVKLRFRIDGVLQDVLHFTKDLHGRIVNRVKIFSKLLLNVDDRAQDGRLTFYYLGEPIDVRVSILPSAYGEEIVMRLLGTGAVSLDLKKLGFRPEVLKILQEKLGQPNGMIITTGPTGSGKTTSLYSFLSELNKPGVKIITLEDPVEYKLEGIVQTPINHTHDFSFAKALRAVLRQDPDIVMVGEIRDQETAETAMQAALTGHLVLSTLHTNNAAGAIPRLLNMGIKPFIMAPALSAVMAQRLVRKLCPACKTGARLSPVVMEKIVYILKHLPKEYQLENLNNLQFFHSKGCGECNYLGYKGRVGIYELFAVDEEIQKLMAKQDTSILEFNKAAREQGMVTITQDGLLKALDGLTDVEEVFRVAGEG